MRCLDMSTTDLGIFVGCIDTAYIIAEWAGCKSGPLFTKRKDILPQDLVKSWSHEIGVYTFSITLKFDRHLSSAAAEMPVKFQNDTIIITSNLTALTFHEIWR